MEALLKSDDFSQKLKDSHKVHPVDYQSVRYWLKKAEKNNNKLLLNMMGRISKYLKTPLLRPAVKYSGKESIRFESEHLAKLAELGATVPKVMSQGDDWLLLSDMGKNASGYFKDKNQSRENVRAAYISILSSIKRLHDNDGYLSQAFVRNITFIDGDIKKVGFIDFEDNPLTVLTLEQAKAKDLLYFTSSMARFFLNDEESFKEITALYLSNYSREIKDLLRQTRRALLWTLKMPFQENLGKDYKKLKLFLLSTDFLEF